MLPKGYDSEQEDGRRERKMSEFEMTVSYRFAAFCVKVLKLSACKCYEEIGRRNEKEISLSLLHEDVLSGLCYENKYPAASYFFYVHGSQVEVRDDGLGEAIEQLEKSQQDLLLLYFFLGFTIKEIAEMYQCSVRTIIRRKDRALASMRQALEAE